MIDPYTGAPDETSKMLYDEGLIFCGRLDLSYGDSKHTVADLKTTQPASLGKLVNMYSNQLSLYGYLKTLNTGNMVERVIVHGFSKHVTMCKYQQETLTMPHDNWVKRYHDIFDVLKDAGKEFITCRKNDKFPKRGYLNSGCKDMFGITCPFKPVCFPNDYSPEAHKEAMGTLINEVLKRCLCWTINSPNLYLKRAIFDFGSYRI